MEKKHLIINIGSASKKYALYSRDKLLFRVHFERERNKFSATVKTEDTLKERKVSALNYEDAFEYLVHKVLPRESIANAESIGSVAIRVVAPGNYFTENKIIDAKYLKKLRGIKKEAPLHIIPLLIELDKINSLFPNVPKYAISDSAFYRNLPYEARLYALPKQDAETLDIYRYGYHGISMQYILKKIRESFADMPKKIIICHLGGGASITAIRNRKPIDTSMGFTPLEGLPMGQRIGNIDAGAAIYLAKKLKLNLDELESYLNSKCGLLGLSGLSPYVKELMKFEEKGDKNAEVALNYFAYWVKKYIGSYMAALGGLDLLVFTATVGERSSAMRLKICRGLEELGIVINKRKNNTVVNRGGFIESKNSKVKISVLATDEMDQMKEELNLIYKRSEN